MPRKKSKQLNVAKQMPRLRHRIPGEEYDNKKSEVINWIVSQPEIRQWLFDKLKSYGYIAYLKEPGQWVGIEHEEPCPHDNDWEECPVCRH